MEDEKVIFRMGEKVYLRSIDKSCLMLKNCSFKKADYFQVKGVKR